MESEANNPYNKYDGVAAADLTRRMSELAERIDLLEQSKKEHQKEYDAIRKRYLPDAMADEGIENIRLEGVGAVSVRSDVYVTIPAESRDVAYDWLRGTGHGGIIKETVHSSTLRATVKEMLRKGAVLPDPEVLKVTPFDIAVLTRKKKGERK